MKLRRIEPVLAGLALISLLPGFAVYAFARPGNAFYVSNRLGPVGDHINNLLGSFAFHLPSLSHTFSFSILTALALGLSARSIGLASAGWMACNCILELSQVPRSAADLPFGSSLLDSWAGGFVARYVLDGRFDSGDLLATCGGALLAVAVTRLAIRKTKNET